MKLNGNSILELSQKPILSEKQIDKILKDIYKGSEDIPAEMYASTRNKLSEGVNTGYGTDYDLKDVEMVFQLKKNVAVFTAFKANHYAVAMRSLLLDETGKKRSFDDFRTQAQKLDPKYNQLWLEAEYNMAIRQARSAKQWLGFEKDKAVYPNLEYMPSRSAVQSLEHKNYYGVILPIDDPFWNTAMPPSRWNCKCWVKQTKVDSNAPDIEAPEKVPGISGNSGKTKMIFDASHAYMQNLSKLDEEGVRKELNRLREMDNEYIIYKVGNNAVLIHINSDFQDLKDNLSYSIPFVKLSKRDMELRKETFIKKVSNPELYFLETIGDRVAWKEAGNVVKYIEKGFHKKLKKDGQLYRFESVFIGLDFMGKLNNKNLFIAAEKIRVRLEKYEKIKFLTMKNGENVMIIENNSKVNITNLFVKMKKELLK